MGSTAGDTAKGALAGAGTGAAIGSVAGPYGTVIGGAVGGIAGGISGWLNHHDDPAPAGNPNQAQINALTRGGFGQGIPSRTPGSPDPMAGQYASWVPDAAKNMFSGTADYGQQDITHYQAPQLQLGTDDFRRAQLQQLGQLQGIASGQQQGAGELAAQRQIANALAAQQAQARMARGGNAALAYRNAANQSASLGLSGVGMGQQAAMTDQMNAQGMMGQVGAQGRASDIGVAQANAGYQAGAQQLNSSNYMGLLSQLNGANQANSAQQQAASLAQQQRNDTLLGAGLSTAGTVAAAYASRQPSGAAATVAPRGNVIA